MDKRIRLNLLYDYYKDFFTEKQQSYFEDYYNNYSLGEIAEVNEVSRNAVHNQLKIVEDRLEEIENILNLVDKKEKILALLQDKVDRQLLNKIEDIL